ncbi:MAG: hypothetical protein KF902_07450 [Phycisphaeraceae bacterium]|nr:hypothetical protein [Phycisphaeraceae bacterium]
MNDASSCPAETRVLAENIPSSIKAIDRWVVWRSVPDEDGGKPKKIPINPKTGRAASVSDNTTWTTFDEALSYLRSDPELAGLMFVLCKCSRIVGIDLDNCVGEDLQVSKEAVELIEEFDTYTEASPSGTGFKMLLWGEKPGSACRKKDVFGCSEIEIYEHARFWAMTGNVVSDGSAEIEPRQEELEDLYSELFPPKPERPRPSSIDGFSGDDAALLRKARDAANGGKFTRLYDAGDISEYGGDDSAADLALVSMLAFWTGPDHERIARIFKASALYRPKWDRDDYRELTIGTALDGMTHFYGQKAARESTSGAPLPEVDLGPDEHRVIGEVVEALAADPDLFQRGGQLVRVIWIAEGKTPRPTIRELEPPTLREIITRNVVLMKFDAKTKEMVHAHPSGWLVSAVHSRGEWQGIRTLNGISQAPVLRPDGSVVQSPGYDAVTGVLYVPSHAFPMVPHDVNVDDASEAMRHLLDLVRDFPFASPEHAAAWIAGLLTIVARHTFTGNAPLFLVDANVRGAGKTLLAQIAGRIALGHELPVSSYSHDPAEMRKGITTMVMAGEPVVLLDNLSGVFGNEAVDRQLTSARWRDRVLGANAQVDLPMTTTLWATGNNVSIAADTARRTIHIRLDSPLERPEDRADFQQRDIMDFVAANGPSLYIDAIMIVAAYLRAGCPQAKGIRPMGSFEGWSRVIRGAVIWVGLIDPCSTRDELELVADSGKDTLGTLLDAWAAFDPKGEGVIIADAVRHVYTEVMGQLPSDAGSVAMRTAFELLAGANGKAPNARQISNKLKAYRRRVIDGRMLDFDPSQKRPSGYAWKVIKRETQA